MLQAPLQLGDGRTLATRTWLAPKASGAVLLLHGVESHAGWFDEVGPALAAGGLTAFAYDRQGWGASSGERGRLRSPAAAVAEVAAAAAKLAQSHPRVHVLGLSWGGVLATYAAARLPGVFASLTLAAPGFFPRRQPGVKDLLAAAFSGGRQPVVLPLTAADFTRRADRQAFIEGDPLRTTAVGLDFCVTTLRLTRAACRSLGQDAALPSMLLLAETDTVVDNARTLALAERQGVRAYTLPGTVHSLVFEDPASVARAVLALACASDKSSAGQTPHAS